MQGDGGDVAAQWEDSQVRGSDTNICKGLEMIAGDQLTDVKLSADGDILTTGILNILSVLAAGLFSLIGAIRKKRVVKMCICSNLHSVWVSSV